jgi:hypothetical protein
MQQAEALDAGRGWREGFCLFLETGECIVNFEN